MPKKKSDAEVVFSATDDGLKSTLKDITSEMKKNNAESKLTQAQMKLTGTATEKLSSKLTSLEKSYDLQSQKVEATSKRLENAKKYYGENSEEVKKLENNLISAKTYEQNLANQIELTSKELSKAKNDTASYADKIESLKDKEKNLTEQSKLVDAEFKNWESTTTKTTSAYTKLVKSQEQLNNQSSITKQKIELVREELVLTEEAFGKNSTQALELKAKLAELDTEFNELNSSSKKLSNVDLSKMGSGIDTTKLAAVSSQLKTVSSKMKDVGTSASMYLTTPIVGAFAVAANAATKYQEGVADITKEVEAQGYSQKEVTSIMKDYSSSAIEWSEKYAVSTDTINEGMFELVSNGYNAKKAIGMMPELLKTMTANSDKSGVSIKLTSSLLEQFGLNLGSDNEVIKNGNSIMGEMTEATHKSAMSLEDLQTISSNAGSAMHAMHVSTSDFLSLSGKLVSTGLDASSVGTGLSAMMTRLAAPTSTASKLLQQYNVNVYDSAGKMRNVYDILGDMQGAYGKMTDTEKNYFLQQVVGQQNMKVGATLMQGNLQGYKDLSKEISNSSDTVDKYYNTMSKTSQFSQEDFKQSLSDLAIVIGQKLLPILTPFIQKITDIVKAFTNTSQSTQQLIIIIGLIAAAIGPVLIVIAQIISAVSIIADGIGLLMSGALIPFIPLIAGIVAAIAAAILIFQNWGAISTWFQGVFSGLGTLFSGFGPTLAIFESFFTNTINNVKLIFSGLISVISGIWDIIVGLFTNNGDKISQGIHEVFQGLINIITGALSQVINNVTSSLGIVVNVFGSILGGIGSIAGNAFDNVWHAVTHPLDTLKSLVSGAMDFIKGLFNVKLSIPKIPLPHFSLSGSFNPLKGQIPSLSVDWYAKGGVFNAPSVIGVGEAGQEAVLPLNDKVLGNLASKIDRLRDKGLTPSSSQVINNDFKLEINGDVKDEVTARRMVDNLMNQITTLQRGKNTAFN